MKITPILLFGLVAAVLGAATLVNPLQIKPPGTGTFVFTAVNGVISWIAPTTTTAPNFSDAEVPSGTINGTNTVFTLAHASVNTGQSLMLHRNGILQTGTGTDYTLTLSTATPPVGTITFTTPPQTGDSLIAWYRY